LKSATNETLSSSHFNTTCKI